MLVALLLIGAMSLISLRMESYRLPDHYYFLNDYALSQSEAIKEKRGLVFSDGISFNPMGHINMARTIDFGKKKVTLNLGSGYALIR